MGDTLNTFNAVIGMVVSILCLPDCPIIGWLEQSVMDSSILAWLVVQLSFVQAMLPEVFHTMR